MKTHKISLIVSLLFLLAACSEGFNSTKSNFNSFQSPSVSDPLRIEGQRLYNISCAGCHGSLPYPSSDGLFSNQADVSQQQISDAISNNLGGMGQFSTLPAGDLNAITRALSTPTTVDPGSIKKSSTPTSSQIVVGTRSYFKSKMDNIFGPTGAPNAQDRNILLLTENLINSQVPSFEGFCSRYEDNCPGVAANNLEVGMSPNPSTTRKGYSSKACSEVLSINRSINNALAKVSLNVNSPQNTANLQKLYSLFKPGTAISTESMAALNQLSSAAGQGMNGWRFVMLSMCVSSAFEAI